MNGLKTTVAVAMPVEEVERLMTMAHTRGVSRAGLIRQAVREFIDREEAGSRSSRGKR